MVNDPSKGHPKPAVPDDASPAAGQRRIDRIDKPARPLGDKRAALQLRRSQLESTKARQATGHDNDGSRVLTSHDGQVTFNLQKTPQGLMVTRSQAQAIGPRLSQTLVFKSLLAFDRWCSVEPLRFRDAILYQQLLREGHAVLDGPW